MHRDLNTTAWAAWASAAAASRAPSRCASAGGSWSGRRRRGSRGTRARAASSAPSWCASSGCSCARRRRRGSSGTRARAASSAPSRCAASGCCSSRRRRRGSRGTRGRMSTLPPTDSASKPCRSCSAALSLIGCPELPVGYWIHLAHAQISPAGTDVPNGSSNLSGSCRARGVLLWSCGERGCERWGRCLACWQWWSWRTGAAHEWRQAIGAVI